MKLSQVINYRTLLEYTKQNHNVRIKRVNPHTPQSNNDNEIELIFNYYTPIGYIINKEIYCPHYVKENFISMTTAKISGQLCNIGNCVSIETFIQFVYEYLEYPMMDGDKNYPWFRDYVDTLIGDK